MRNDQQRDETPKTPKAQAGEEFGSIKGQQRGEDDFKGRSDLPRGSEPEAHASATRRG